MTRSTGNVVFEIDGRPALALYKEYLGPKASELPSSGLLFPLAMQDGDSEKVLVRTLLAVDEQAQSLTFAGDVPQGASVQLMKADFDRLVGGAVGAASMVNSTTRGSNLTKLAIAVSCVGRRLVLGERTDDEIEAVRENLPPKTSLVGFYSYGELSPHGLGSCDLHNQTMTLTTFGESAIPLPKRTPAPAPARRAQTPLAPATDPLPQSTTPSTPTPAPATHTGGDGRLRVETFTWTGSKWSVPVPPQLDSPRTLVLAFGPRSLMDAPEPLRALSRVYPLSHVVGCSGAGQIVAGDVSDDALTVLVARFARTDLVSATAEVTDASQSHAAGLKLSRDLAAPDLRAVFVLSEGLTVNGSELVRGLNEGLGIDKGQIVLTGGLAGDGTRFERTWVLHGGEARSGLVVAVGFYGDHIVVGHGSKGGWDKFGPERVVTRSAGNVLYSLDGRPALGLYKEYLGPRAKDLPSSGLLFPLAMRSGPNDDKVLVRTVLAVDEAAQSMTFAGDLPEGSLVQLMKADFDRLVSGAEGAARDARALAPAVDSASFAVAVSCVGRRLVLADRTEEEVEAVANVLPKGAAVVGFYSYGELSPYGQGACDLHNQTMTLTTFAESAQPLARGANPMARSAPPAPERPLEARARATPPPSVPPA
ncbi:MAG: FIST C-terminal domain-containing protein, partial [Myxococcota bacterium]